MTVIVHIVMVLLTSLLVSTRVADCEAAGPWKGQIVDQETGSPIDGAVVLAVFYKATGMFHATSGSEYYDSEEVVTDPEGRFVIQARQTWTVNPFSRIWGPQFHIFKSGYGRWRFRNAEVRDPRMTSDVERFIGEGAMLELPQLKTKKQRVDEMALVGLPQVPNEKMPKFFQAINKERTDLGLTQFPSK